jgi:protein SCO1/2
MVSWSSIVAGCSFVALAGCAARAGLPSYSSVPAFTLTDQTGAPFNSAEKLANSVWIADFIYTTCPGPCPRMSSQMHQVENSLDGTGVKLVSFTVDPERDTPPVLAEYAGHFGAKPGTWFFLTGSIDDLHHLSRGVFMLGNGDGMLEHSTRFLLIDRRSQVRGYYDSSDQDAIPKLIADARSLLKKGTDHSVSTRKAPIAGSIAAVDRAVYPLFQQAPIALVRN